MNSIQNWLTSSVEYQAYLKNGWADLLVVFTALTMLMTCTIQLGGLLAQKRKVFNLRERIDEISTPLFLLLVTYFCVFLSYGLSERIVGVVFNALVLTGPIFVIVWGLWERREFTVTETMLAIACVIIVTASITTPHKSEIYTLVSVLTFAGPLMQVIKICKDRSSDGLEEKLFRNWTIVCVTWTIYGWLTKDAFVFGVAVSFAIAYVFIWLLILKFPPKHAAAR